MKNKKPDSRDLRYNVKRYCEVRSLRPDTGITRTLAVRRSFSKTGFSSVQSIEIGRLLNWKDAVVDSSASTCSNYHRRLKDLLRYCVRKGMIGKSPCENAPPFSPH